MIKKKSSYIEYLDARNLYGWAMSRKLPVNGFSEIFIENYSENSNTEYFLQVDIDYPKKTI